MLANNDATWTNYRLKMLKECGTFWAWNIYDIKITHHLCTDGTSKRVELYITRDVLQHKAILSHKDSKVEYFMQLVLWDESASLSQKIPLHK